MTESETTPILDLIQVLPPALTVPRLIEMALATCASPHTRRMYGVQLRKFIESGHPLNREGVALHIQQQRDAGLSGSTLITTMAAIRKLASEALIRGLMSQQEFSEINSVSVGRIHKSNTGVWMTIDQTKSLLSLPDRSTWYGQRDACLLAIMLGCGLRRAEMSGLKWEDYHSRDGRMCIHVKGKGNKTRTLPVPLWAQPDMDAWQVTSQTPSPSPKFYKYANITAYTREFLAHYVLGGLSPNGLYVIVQDYAKQIGLDLSPHDLRRTLAQLLRKSGAMLEQIQYTLGHENISTTVLYLGSKLELSPGVAAVDLLAISNTSSPEVLDRITMALEAERASIERNI